MRVTLDPSSANDDRVVVHGADGPVLELWSRRLEWRCRDRRLDLQVLGAEAMALPEAEPSELPEGAVARVGQAIAGSGALILLRDPAEAFGVGRISFTEGVRLFAIADEADEACWDAALSLGQPTYGVRGNLACEVMRARPASVLSALAYGLFVCEQGLAMTSLLEDRAGLAWEVDAADAEAAVILRNGYEATRIRGRAGAWKDRGNEGYVRVVIRSAAGACWTQPRFIAPQAAKA